MGMGDFGNAAATAYGVVIVSFIGGIPFFRVLHAWLVDSSMDTGVALTLLIAIAATIMSIIGMWNSPVKWALLAVLLGLNFIVPALGGAADKISDRRMTSEDIERFTKMIAKDPRNAAAHAFLADAYMKVGRYKEAVDSYQTAIEVDPKHSQREKSQLEVAKKKLEREETAPEICPGCYAEQPREAIRCQKCGHYMKMSYFLRDMSREAAPAGAILAGGFVAASIFPPPLSGVGCVASIIGAGVFLWKKAKIV